MRVIGSGAMACLVRGDRRSYGRLAMWCPRDNSGERERRLSTASGGSYDIDNPALAWLSHLVAISTASAFMWHGNLGLHAGDGDPDARSGPSG